LGLTWASVQLVLVFLKECPQACAGVQQATALLVMAGGRTGCSALIHERGKTGSCPTTSRLWVVPCFLTYDSPRLRSAARSPVSVAICTRSPPDSHPIKSLNESRSI